MIIDANKNAERFTGFADIYDSARPKMPEYVIETVTKYFGCQLGLVVDLGCGTGLSTLAWEGNCRQAVGIEPSGDMLEIALKKATGNITFICAFANNTTLGNEVADAVICSQSFHWMEPLETLFEINRILKPGGIFATVDCDWPPVCNWQAELAYNELFNNANELLNAQENNGTYQWAKNRHLNNMQQSGYFRYCREIVFSNREPGSAKRFINLAKSQGGLQSILNTKPCTITPQIEEFENIINNIPDERFILDFCYRMRIGVK